MQLELVVTRLQAVEQSKFCSIVLESGLCNISFLTSIEEAPRINDKFKIIIEKIPSLGEPLEAIPIS